MTQSIFTYRQHVGAGVVYRHYGLPHSGKTVCALGIAEGWRNRGLESALVVPSSGVALHFEKDRGEPRSVCLSYRSWLALEKSPRYLIMDGCERFNTDEGDPVVLFVRSMMMKDEYFELHAFYCIQPGQAIDVAMEWERAPDHCLEPYAKAGSRVLAQQRHVANPTIESEQSSLCEAKVMRSLVGCRDQLGLLQAGPFANTYNAEARYHIEQAIEALKDRERERDDKRGGDDNAS